MDVDKLTDQAVALLREEQPITGLRVFSLKSGVAGPGPAEVHLGALWRGFAPVLRALDQAGVSPRTCVLRVVQYISPDDEVGAGVPVDGVWVATLARLNGFVDIDIYVEG